MTSKIHYDRWDETQVQEVIRQHGDYLGVLKWAYYEYGDDLVYACSFGAEGIVLIDLIYKVYKKAKVIFLDTGLHFPETYQLIKKVKEKNPLLQIDMIKPKLTVKEQGEQHGQELWKHNPNLCCHMRKVLPLQEALKDSAAWLSGLRRDQTLSRKNTEYINRDHKFKKIKICPLIHWTWEDVMNYIHLNQLPYNPLHDKGYPSIGCVPCTNPVSSSDDSRAGRWSGIDKTECGLHDN